MALIAVILMSVIVVILDLIPELDVPSDVREQAQRYEW
jgi:hypothetical protein